MSVAFATSVTTMMNFIQANAVPSSSLSAFGITGTNYCGPNYTGGKLFGGDFTVEPNGAVDVACRSHDQKYAAAEGEPGEREQKLTADVQLIRDMVDILARPSEYSSRDVQLAVDVAAAFAAKVTYGALSKPGVLFPADWPALALPFPFYPVDNAVSDLFTAAQRYRPWKDPLTLDLDGDGLETVGTNAGILFDHDGDGIKNGTGWVKPDDGFLVLDRNGNGTIDNGTELFGDSTPLYAGGKAADGFAALAQEDILDRVDIEAQAVRRYLGAAFEARCQVASKRESILSVTLSDQERRHDLGIGADCCPRPNVAIAQDALMLGCDVLLFGMTERPYFVALDTLTGKVTHRPGTNRGVQASLERSRMKSSIHDSHQICCLS